MFVWSVCGMCGEGGVGGVFVWSVCGMCGEGGVGGALCAAVRDVWRSGSTWCAVCSCVEFASRVVLVEFVEGGMWIAGCSLQTTCPAAENEDGYAASEHGLATTPRAQGIESASAERTWEPPQSFHVVSGRTAWNQAEGGWGLCRRLGDLWVKWVEAVPETAF